MSGSNLDLAKQFSERLEKGLKCLECGKISKNPKSLGVHIRICHGTKIYYDKYIKSPADGKCKVCGNETKFINIDRGYRKYCSDKCHSIGLSGKGNPFFGKKHDQNTVNSIVEKRSWYKGDLHHFFGKKGDLHPAYGRKHTELELCKMHNALVGKAPNIEFTEEVRKKISIANKGKKLSLDHKEKISQSNIGKHLWSEEAKKNLSEKVAQAHMDGKLNKHFRSGYYMSSKVGKRLWYRSSYELEALKILDDDCEVVFFEYEPEKIEVEIDGRKRFSVPDFRVHYRDGTFKMIEIKPKKIIRHPKIFKRIEACKKYYADRGIQYELWTEQKLGING